MAIVFPTSPTLNQQFSSDNKVWQWDGEKWIAASSGASGVSQSDLDAVEALALLGL